MEIPGYSEICMYFYNHLNNLDTRTLRIYANSKIFPENNNKIYPLLEMQKILCKNTCSLFFHEKQKMTG